MGKLNEKRKPACWKMNVRYQATCIRYHENSIKATNQGESSKSLQSRALSHKRWVESINISSFITRHNFLFHPSGRISNPKYFWEPKAFYMKLLERAIEEALAIKESFQLTAKDPSKYICMNSKMEFLQNILPGIG